MDLWTVGYADSRLSTPPCAGRRIAAGGLPDLWGSGRAYAVGGRKESADTDLCLVFGPLGQTPVLEGSGGDVPHFPGQRVSRCGDGGAHQDLSDIHAIGIDEIAWQRRHKYVTRVYQIDSHCVEGFNGKAKLTTRKAFGFRTYHALEVALYHALGSLPEPEFTHRFC